MRLRAVLLGLIGLVAACQHSGDDAWSDPAVSVEAPVVAGSRYPNLANGPDGSVVMSWLSPTTDGGYELLHATWSGEAWTPPRSVSAGADWFVNWADFASVVPLADDLWAAHWLQQRPGSTYAYDVRIVVSRDRGQSWSAPMSPHDDGTPTEHGFVSMLGDGGALHAVWLDGRGTAGHDHETGGGAMTLRAARIDGNGRLSKRGTEIDARVCDCCQTDTALTADGPVVVYRDRDENEIRDIAIVRAGPDGWTAPETVHRDGWRIAACPVNGPAVAANGRTLAVAWFTAPDVPRVRLAFSADAGRSFGAPLEVASGAVAGRVDLILIDADRAVVSWLADDPKGTEIRAQAFTSRGPDGPVRVVAKASAERASGFPRMVRAGDALLFAWTEASTPPIVRTALVSLR